MWRGSSTETECVCEGERHTTHTERNKPTGRRNHPRRQPPPDTCSSSASDSDTPKAGDRYRLVFLSSEGEGSVEGESCPRGGRRDSGAECEWDYWEWEAGCAAGRAGGGGAAPLLLPLVVPVLVPVLVPLPVLLPFAMPPPPAPPPPPPAHLRAESLSLSSASSHDSSDEEQGLERAYHFASPPISPILPRPAHLVRYSDLNDIGNGPTISSSPPPKYSPVPANNANEESAFISTEEDSSSDENSWTLENENDKKGDNVQNGTCDIVEGIERKLSALLLGEEGSETDAGAGVSVLASETTSVVPCVQLLHTNPALEEGLADDDSWVEDISDAEGEEEECNTSPAPAPCRRAIDLTLHTIVEESCDEGDSHQHTSTPLSRTHLENYFCFELGEAEGESDRAPPMSDASSACSEPADEAPDECEEVRSLERHELAASRLEAYFLSGLMGFSSGSGSNRDVSTDTSENEGDDGGESGEDACGRRRRRTHRHAQLEPAHSDTSSGPAEPDVPPPVAPQHDKRKRKTRAPPAPLPHNSRDSGFVGSCDDLAPEPAPVSLTRKDSFNNWSSDEETNLMMSKMRQFFKTMVGIEGGSGAGGEGSGCAGGEVARLEGELARLMRSVPGLAEDDVRSLVSYLSGDEQWSEGEGATAAAGGTTAPADAAADEGEVRRAISASCREIVQEWEGGGGGGGVLRHIAPRLVQLMRALDTPYPTPPALPPSAPPTAPSPNLGRARSQEGVESGGSSRVSWRGSFESALLVEGEGGCATGGGGAGAGALSRSLGALSGAGAGGAAAAVRAGSLPRLAGAGAGEVRSARYRPPGWRATASTPHLTGTVVCEPLRCEAASYPDKPTSCWDCGTSPPVNPSDPNPVTLKQLRSQASHNMKLYMLVADNVVKPKATPLKQTLRIHELPDPPPVSHTALIQSVPDTSIPVTPVPSTPTGSTVPAGSTNIRPKRPEDSIPVAPVVHAASTPVLTLASPLDSPPVSPVTSCPTSPRPSMSSKTNKHVMFSLQEIIERTEEGLRAADSEDALDTEDAVQERLERAYMEEMQNKKRWRVKKLGALSASLPSIPALPALRSQSRAVSTKQLAPNNETESEREVEVESEVEVRASAGGARNTLPRAHSPRPPHPALLAGGARRSDSLASVYSGVGDGDVAGGDGGGGGEVQLGLLYSYRSGSLELVVGACRNLPLGARRRLDPYVKAYLLPDTTKLAKRKTRVKRNTCAPRYDERLAWRLPLEQVGSRTLWVSAWHADTWGRNEFLGEVRLELAGRVFDEAALAWYALEGRGATGAGELARAGTLQVALKWARGEGALLVRIEEARELRAPAWRHHPHHPPDAFLKCVLVLDGGSAVKARTGVCRGTWSPAWAHTCRLSLPTACAAPGAAGAAALRAAKLHLSVWDRDRLASNEFIAAATIPPPPADSEEGQDVWGAVISRPELWVEAALTLRHTN